MIYLNFSFDKIKKFWIYYFSIFIYILIKRVFLFFFFFVFKTIYIIIKLKSDIFPLQKKIIIINRKSGVIKIELIYAWHDFQLIYETYRIIVILFVMILPRKVTTIFFSIFFFSMRSKTPSWFLLKGKFCEKIYLYIMLSAAFK